MPKSDMFPCKEENFDFPFCIESLNQLRTVVNVKHNSSGDSVPMPIAVGKSALRKESDIVTLRWLRPTRINSNSYLPNYAI